MPVVQMLAVQMLVVQMLVVGRHGLGLEGSTKHMHYIPAPTIQGPLDKAIPYITTIRD